MIYLASASPRRQELLRQLGVEFEVMPSNILEVRQAGESPADYVLRVARDKAQFVARLVRERGLPVFPVLGADTEVVLDGEILGKPENAAHGMAILRRLAGRTHEVLSAICVWNREREYSALNTSHVTFRPLTPTEIEQYWKTGEPVGKAGAYAIQGRAATFIAKLEGSYSGVMGLPLYELDDILRKTEAGGA
ncbi:nucleoside triphosphate pyrophosphatase [Sulfuricaulis sp.]|jgi:septum formation protein|uniref:Maf family protein n=1 Tax=Sulfuricaulis sp. TaxID=2003553 RepID=UPI00355AC3BF